MFWSQVMGQPLQLCLLLPISIGNEVRNIWQFEWNLGQLWDMTSQIYGEILGHSSLKFTLSLISGNWVYTTPYFFCLSSLTLVADSGISPRQNARVWMLQTANDILHRRHGRSNLAPCQAEDDPFSSGNSLGPAAAPTTSSLYPYSSPPPEYTEIEFKVEFYFWYVNLISFSLVNGMK